MKNIIFLLLSALIIISGYSCKDKPEPTPDITVIPIEPIPIDSSSTTQQKKWAKNKKRAYNKCN